MTIPAPLKYLFQQANIGQSRSSVLNPLQWALVIIGGITLIAAGFGPHFVAVAGLAMEAILFSLFVYAYIYFMVKNPDALRSEHYSLSKFAIEKGLLGDSLIGVLPDQTSEPSKTIDAPAEPQGQNEE